MPLPADTQLTVTDLHGHTVTEIHRSDSTAVHLVEVAGLTPGPSYAYVARSAGITATPRMLEGLHQDRLGFGHLGGVAPVSTGPRSSDASAK